MKIHIIVVLLEGPGPSWELPGCPGFSMELLGFLGAPRLSLEVAVAAAAAVWLPPLLLLLLLLLTNKHFLTFPDPFVLHIAKSSVVTERKTRPSLPLQGEHIPLLNRANLILTKILIFH